MRETRPGYWTKTRRLAASIAGCAVAAIVAGAVLSVLDMAAVTSSPAISGAIVTLVLCPVLVAVLAGVQESLDLGHGVAEDR